MVLFLLLFFSHLAFAEPLTNHEFTQIYEAIEKEVPYAPENIKKQIKAKVFDEVSKSDLLPSAIAVGVMGRCQKGVGACLGTQINIGKKDGKWVYSSYAMGGLSFGAAEMYKVEFFIAVCYGDCLSSYAQGIFLSTETGTTIVGGISTFVEFGTDLSDLFYMNNKKPSFTSIWDYKTVYLGFGYNIGIGLGFSGTCFYYRHIETKPLKELDLSIWD